MKRRGAPGLAAPDRLIPAANEEFSDLVKGLDGLECSRPAWDPYEVWRTRVKSSSRAKSESERDPFD